MAALDDVAKAAMEWEASRAARNFAQQELINELNGDYFKLERMFTNPPSISAGKDAAVKAYDDYVDSFKKISEKIKKIIPQSSFNNSDLPMSMHPADLRDALNNLIFPYMYETTHMTPNELAYLNKTIDNLHKYNPKKISDITSNTEHATSILDTAKHVNKNILPTLNPSQQETFHALLPDWNGTLDELHATAGLL